MRLAFATWLSDAPSGGNLYDHKLSDGFRGLGVDLTVHRIGGTWPGADEDDRAHLAAALSEATIVVDAILAGDAPEVVAAAVAAGRSVTVLVHHFGADSGRLSAAQRTRFEEREGRALRAATGVLCTSSWAAAELRRRYGLDDVGVAVPGVDGAELAIGSEATGVPRLLALGSLTPSKDQLTLITALARVSDLRWTARLVGSDTVDPGYADRVRRSVADLRLGDRIEVTGARTGAVLEAEWRAADLLVHPSRSETYGIVVLEALARGLPAVVTAGTGAVEALAAGADAGGEIAGTSVLPADTDAWAAALRAWLTDATLRRSWRKAALRQRDRLPPWSATAEAALAYLRRDESHSGYH